MDTQNDNLPGFSHLQREKTILEIMRLVLTEKQTSGRKHSILSACRQVGIDPSTWYLWANKGYVDGPLQKMSDQLNQMVYEKVLQKYEKVVDAVLSIATGQAPDDAPKMDIKATHLLRAAEMVTTWAPVRPLGQANDAAISEAEFIEKYQPQQILIQNNAFIYNGRQNAPPSMAEAKKQLVDE